MATDSTSLVPHPPIEVDIGPWYDSPEPPARRDRDLLRRYAKTLYRHRWLELGVLATVLSIAVGYLVVATPIYEASLKLLIEPDNPNVVTFKEVVEQSSGKLDYYETQLGILRSRSLVRSTLDRLKLWNHPQFTSDGPRRTQLIRRAATLAGIELTPTSSPDPNRIVVSPGETAAQSHAIDAFLNALSLTYRPDNRLVDVRFRSADPRLAASVANTLAQSYIDDKRQLKIEASRDASAWLQDRIAEQRRQLEASERALQQYREQHPDIPLADQQGITTQKLADLNGALTRARTERIEAESLYDQLQSIQGDPSAFDTSPVILSNPFIQQLKTELASLQRDQVKLSERLGDEHPDMIKVNAAIARVQQQLRAEVAKITEAARNQVTTIAAKERSLSGALDEQKREALTISGRSIRYEALQREAASNRQMFDALLQRAKEAEVSSEITATNVRVVDPAEVPQFPAAPRTLVVLVFAMLVGVPLAAGAGLAREYMDDRIDSPQEIRSHLGVRVLGLSPRVPQRLMSAAAPGMSDTLPPEFAEAFRAIRANLILSVPPQEKKSLLVTSTAPGEGKTLVACNLAVALARAGRRVLLIDADMRRPQIHRNFHVPLEPGLAAVLQEAVAMTSAIRETAVSGLSVVSAGMPPDTPGDLLELPVFEHAIASVRERFDWIVIDSPPVMAASDTIALAHAAAAVVFVVGAHMISARAARAALEQLQPTGATIIGAVLSRADVSDDAPYSYAKYGSYYRH